jgi:hypothetical protein
VYAGDDSPLEMEGAPLCSHTPLASDRASELQPTTPVPHLDTQGQTTLCLSWTQHDVGGEWRGVWWGERRTVHLGLTVQSTQS